MTIPMRTAQPFSRRPANPGVFLYCLFSLIMNTPVHALGNILDQYNVHDLSHLVPLYEPLNGDATKSDLSKPVKNSRPVAGSGGMLGVRTGKPQINLRHGYLQWGFYYIEEHYSTHLDSTDHFITTNEALVTVENPDQRDIAAFTLEELIGPIVYIDVSELVRQELAKNGGKPSINRTITNFDNDSGNNIDVDHIDSIAEYLVDGVYLVLNLGWESFYIGPPPNNGVNWEHPYNNNLNHPGITPAAVDRLIEIENERGIRIAGIVADNIGVESGHSLRGDMGTDKTITSELVMYLHAIGLNRGWKLVENAANLSILGNYDQGDCDLIIGAPRVAGASGTPSRLMAVCKKLPAD